MLKRLCGLLLFGTFLTAQAIAYDEGIDYTKLVQPQPTETGEQVEVVEVFWYGCPHCWHLEPALAKWLESLPEGVQFRRMPATGGLWDVHARAFYAAQAMGKLEVLHAALFKAIHDEKRSLRTKDELVRFAGEIGLDTDAFSADFDSFMVEVQLRKAKEMSTRYGIDSVPTIIVNGKYRTGPSQAGGHERMLQLIDALIAEELKGGS